MSADRVPFHPAGYAPGASARTEDTCRIPEKPFFTDLPGVGPTLMVEGGHIMRADIPIGSTHVPAVVVVGPSNSGTPHTAFYYTFSGESLRSLGEELLRTADRMEGEASAAADAALARARAPRA